MTKIFLHKQKDKQRKETDVDFLKNVSNILLLSLAYMWYQFLFINCTNSISVEK